MARNSLWTGILVLSLGSMAWAADPPATASLNTTPSFDLKSEGVQKILRATVATQTSTTHRVEPQRREKPDLAEALNADRPAPVKPDEPRLPERAPECQGFVSCGIETLLGGTDDEEEYARQLRHRLMNQGSITNPKGPGPSSK
jgi:hypothetical protein